MIAHCLFEQSGTFKNEFKKLGINAYDYDILNDYGETDFQIDLFAEIESAYDGNNSIFSNISKDDLILSFFPCTRFESCIPLAFRGELFQQKNWSDSRKLEYAMKLHNELHHYYMLISKLVLITIKNGLQLVIENPYTQPHYLTRYWCIKPKIIDTDRRENGDFMKKPTQFFFINREPFHNLVFECLDFVEFRTVDKMLSHNGKNRQVCRSEISSQYASRFIRQYLIGG